MVNPHVAVDIPYYAFAGASRKTLPLWVQFLDSCVTYHLMIIELYLTGICELHIHLKRHCNAGVLTCTQKGDWGPFKFWVNKHGIANLLSIPQLEEDDYTVDKTNKVWTIITPKGEKIVLKLGVGLYKGMPYIDLRESHGFAMIKTVHGNYEGFTKRKVQ